MTKLKSTERTCDNCKRKKKTTKTTDPYLCERCCEVIALNTAHGIITKKMKRKVYKFIIVGALAGSLIGNLVVIALGI